MRLSRLVVALATKRAAAAVVGLAANTTCIGNGQNDTDISNALINGGDNAVVELCPGAIIPIYNTIGFSNNGQTVQTQGLPTGSRATLRITVAPGMNTPQAIFAMCSPSPYGPQDDAWANVGIRNVVLDGNRDVPGIGGGSDSTVTMGGGAGGQFIDHVEFVNNRGPGCIYVTPSLYDGQDGYGNGALSMTNSVFRNCTTGIDLDGVNTLIANNEFIMGNGVSIQMVYNGLGTNITNNTFTATGAPNLAVAGISLGQVISGGYPTLLSGTSITNNRFSADQFMSAGILLGADLGVSNQAAEQNGPLNVTGNSFSGKIAFPIAIDNFSGPINITQNTLSDLVSPVLSFTDSSTCNTELQSLAAGNHRFVFGNLTNNVTVQSDFYNASNAALGQFSCFEPNIGPFNKTFAPQVFNTSNSVTLASLRGGIDVDFQPDGNLVVYDNHASSPPSPSWAAGSIAPNSNCSGLCVLNFTTDGNLVVTYNGSQLWQSNSGGMGGTTLVALYESPWLEVRTANGSVVWNTS